MSHSTLFCQAYATIFNINKIDLVPSALKFIIRTAIILYLICFLKERLLYFDINILYSLNTVNRVIIFFSSLDIPEYSSIYFDFTCSHGMELSKKCVETELKYSFIQFHTNELI